jgi:uncharacterized hydrophobic protein (TIGR00341 family)
MPLKIIEVLCKHGHADTLVAAAEGANALDVFVVEGSEDRLENVRIVVESIYAQRIVDTVHRVLQGSDGWRLNLIPLEATLPKPTAKNDRLPMPGTGSTREEIYHEVSMGARPNQNFVLLVIVSTAAAAIGLLQDNVAVVIGAMVIAPLLGPNIAFAFGCALGDRELMAKSSATNALGLGITFVIAVSIGFVLGGSNESAELMARTQVGLGGVALAIASGIAGALSITTGASAALVGVMEAVALLPPAATAGIMLGAKNTTLPPARAFCWGSISPPSIYRRRSSFWPRASVLADGSTANARSARLP